MPAGIDSRAPAVVPDTLIIREKRPISLLTPVATRALSKTKDALTEAENSVPMHN